MITMKELLKGKDFDSLDVGIQQNLNILLKRINYVRAIWGKPMIVTSGLRTIEEHLKIYADKGIDKSKVPMGSRHLYGQAVDIYDPDFYLTDFCKKNCSEILKEAELWAEDDRTVPRLHLQCSIPRSGARWFKP